MTTTTATIETLTAEVRTLVVGSRQITLSVAKQLDVIDLASIRIMGRVRALKDEDHVIGVGPGGGLSLARYWPGRIWYPLVRPSDLTNNKVTLCGPATGTYTINFEGQLVQIEWAAVSRCVGRCRYTRNNAAPCDPVISARQAAQIQVVIDRDELDCIAQNVLNAAAEAAPLIVLAGLR